MPKKFLNIAHRGFSGIYPENTMLAFQKAREAGAHGIEFDLRITADDKIVVFHDDDGKRLGGFPEAVEDMRWSDLKQIKIFDKEPIALFDEVLLNFPDLVLDIEIKESRRSRQVVESVVQKLNEFKLDSNLITVSSFDESVVQYCRQLQAKKFFGRVAHIREIKPWQLILGSEAHPAKLPSEGVNALVFNSTALKTFWHVFHFKNSIIPLWLWGCETEASWKIVQESDWPIEAVITNHPDKLTEFLKNKN